MEEQQAGFKAEKVSRYLTNSEKAKELAQWRNALASATPGPGSPDPEILPWCETINLIPGVCTLQSCAGHEEGERGPRSSGRLWLRLNETRALGFYKRAFELAVRDCIDRVSLIYQPWGEEIIQVDFRGIPHGQLESSMAELIDFLRSL